MDLSGAIADLATGNYQLARVTAGSWSQTTGEYTAGATTLSTIEAVIVPASGRQLQRLPEAQRSTEAIAIYTATALRTAEASGAPGDRVTYGGRVFEVQSVKPWNEAGGFCEAIAVRCGQ
jgi:hypothetical protein